MARRFVRAFVAETQDIIMNTILIRGEGAHGYHRA
jgi:hypothetical protein